MTNYFNTLNFRHKIQQLGVCEFLNEDKYSEDDIKALKGKKVVIVGCGAQGLNQGLNMRDSGLDVSFVLRQEAIQQKRASYQNATKHGFEVSSYEALIPKADLVCNLTPDKQHTPVVKAIVPHMKKGATLAYSHGFNIVEEGMQIREDITVIMVAPKSPGSEVREEYKRGFGVPTLIAVHEENNPQGKGYEIALAYAIATGGHRAGILLSSFVAEVKSDLMGEQTILCGLLQTGSILCFDKMIQSGIDPAWAAKFVQFGWETITEALKIGGLTHMMNRLSNPAKIKALEISEYLKELMTPLFYKHMDDIISGDFSRNMMIDWANNDKQLLSWREKTSKTDFEKTTISNTEITQQEFFDKGLLMVAIVKSGVELAFEAMIKSGIQKESAYYESLHEVPLIANTIARKKLYEMNRTISDTAEYGCYLFDNECNPLISKYIHSLGNDVIGRNYGTSISEIDDQTLIHVNESIANHPIESIGDWLRDKMRKKTS